MMKRLFDVVISLAALLVLSPLMLAIYAAVRIFDHGPAIFRQVRIGQDCRDFELLKFRSMRMDAEATGGYSTEQNDPRITKIGRILRKTSLDELPQLINVLKGDMSIVGPRPDVPLQQANYSAADWALRHRVRPGITGAAQAELRSFATAEQRLSLDLDYVRQHSVRRDLMIIWRTVGQILTKGGN